MNNCGAIVAAGLGDCKAHLKRFRAMILTERGTTFTASELATTAKLKTLLSADAGIDALYIPLSGFNVTTDAPNIITGSIGSKSVYDDSVPSATAFMDAGFSDYKALWPINNTQVDVLFITKDGLLVVTPYGDGKFKGLRAEIYSQKDIPTFDNPNEAHPVHIFFKDVDEFQDMVVLAMNFKASEIEDLVPIGLDIIQTADYASSDATVKAYLRGSVTGKAGLTDWDILDSNVNDPGVTASDDGAGVYTLTLQKESTGTPADLAAGEYITVQGKLVAATYVTYITPPITIYG